MIGIIDYDAGNIRSVEKALSYLGEETVVSRDPQVLLKADKVCHFLKNLISTILFFQ